MTFRDLVRQFGTAPRSTCTLLNPVVGPEPVAGSSRMKGGTATLILLDCIGAAATAAAEPPDTLAMLLQYQHVQAQTYQHALTNMPTIMSMAAQSLLDQGHIYYLGSGSEGCIGCIDLSEMPDTYGAPFDQSRAFVVGGWTTLKNRDGDISGRNPLLRIDTEHFATDIVPTLRPADSVIVMTSSSTTAPLPNDMGLRQQDVSAYEGCEDDAELIGILADLEESGDHTV